MTLPPARAAAPGARPREESRALLVGDLLAARAAAAYPRHVELDDAAVLLVLIARDDPAKLDAATVRFHGRACLERSFIIGTPARRGAILPAKPTSGPLAARTRAAITSICGLAGQASSQLADITRRDYWILVM
jgi:hypothetical protein